MGAWPMGAPGWPLLAWQAGGSQSVLREVEKKPRAVRAVLAVDWPHSGSKK